MEIFFKLSIQHEISNLLQTYLLDPQRVTSEELLYRKDGYLITRTTLSIQYYYFYSVGDVANQVLSLK